MTFGERLRKGNPCHAATAIPATVATDVRQRGRAVAAIATVAVATSPPIVLGSALDAGVSLVTAQCGHRGIR